VENSSLRLLFSVSMACACAASGCGSVSTDGLFSSDDPTTGGAGAALSSGGNSSAGIGASSDGGSAVIASAGTAALTGGASNLGGNSSAGSAGSAPLGGAGGAAGSAGSVGHGGASGATNVAGSGGIAGASGTGGSPPVLNFELIDDMEDGNINILNLGGRSGLWYTFNDRTQGASQAPIGVSALNPMRGASLWAIETTGAGFTTWGAGIGFTLNQGGAMVSPYDASAFQGVRFFGRSAKGPALITIQIPTTQTDPRGGLCGNDCYHNFAVQRSFTPEWSDFVIYFSDFEQDLKVTTTSIDRAHLYAVEFLTQPKAPFDVWVDDVAFIKKD